VLAAIGGDDQITVLPYLDPHLVAANPKPFLGYSDNTNMLNWLWNLGMAGCMPGCSAPPGVRRPGPAQAHPVGHTIRRPRVMATGTCRCRHRPGGTRRSPEARPGQRVQGGENQVPSGRTPVNPALVVTQAVTGSPGRASTPGTRRPAASHLVTTGLRAARPGWLR